MQHVDRDAKGVEIKTDVDVITDADCITMDDGDLRSGVKKMIDDRIGEVIDGAPEELDTLKEISMELEKNQSGVSTILNKMNSKLEAKDLEGYAKTEDLDEMQYDISFKIEAEFDKIEAEFDKKVDKTQITDSYEESYSDTVPSSKALSNALIAFNKNFAKKVDKVEGKGLSTNDFTNEYKNKINTIEAGNVDLSGYVKTTDIADFKRCIVLSETNYAALSDAEKNRADTLYFLI